MQIYIAVPLTNDAAAFDEAVRETIPAPNRYKLQANAGWLVQFDGTTVELSNAIGVTGQPKGTSAPLGSVIFVPVSGYYGRGPTDMWEWLKTRMEK